MILFKTDFFSDDYLFENSKGAIRSRMENNPGWMRPFPAYPAADN